MVPFCFCDSKGTNVFWIYQTPASIFLFLLKWMVWMVWMVWMGVWKCNDGRFSRRCLWRDGGFSVRYDYRGWQRGGCRGGNSGPQRYVVEWKPVFAYAAINGGAEGSVPYYQGFFKKIGRPFVAQNKVVGHAGCGSKDDRNEDGVDSVIYEV